MTNNAQYILQYLFDTGSLEDVSVEQLRELVNEYPSFNAGHYLLSIKLQKEKDEAFLQETQKTALYFHNPFWLQWLLQNAEERQTFMAETTATAQLNDSGNPQSYTSGATAYAMEEVKEEYHSSEIQKEETAPEAYAFSSTTEEIFRETYITENSIFEERIETIKEEYHPAPVKEEEAVREIQPDNNATEEIFHETPITENPVYEEHVETIKEEYHSAEIQKEEQAQEPGPVNNIHEDINLHETFITENPVFEEHAETIKEEYHPAKENEEVMQQVHHTDNFHEENFHETFITENPVFEEHAETIKEEYHPTKENEEVMQQVHAENSNEENFHETSTTGNPVFEEYAEIIKEEYRTSKENEEIAQEFLPVNNTNEEIYHEPNINETPVLSEPPEEIKEEFHPAKENEETPEISQAGNTEEQPQETYISETPAIAESTEEIKETSPEINTSGHNGEDIYHDIYIAESISPVAEPEEIKEIHPPESAANEQDPALPDQTTNSDEQIAKPETDFQPTFSIRTPQEAKSFELTFEPYHTIDYFASQGIKFIQEENPTDKFGKQLKTFTAWLKTMKKLPLDPLPEDPDDTKNAEIEIIAANSLEEKDIETETMAEVLAKQGKVDRAIELYLKLSLLNPTKIAYFAAKIEHIKRTLL